jgi:signal transduction histidine kinase
VVSDLHAVLALTSAEELPRKIVEAAMTSLGAEDASLLLPGPDGTLRLAYSSRIPESEWPDVRIPLGGSIAGKVARTRKPTIIQDPDPLEGKRQLIRSSIVFPIVSQTALLAVLSFNRSHPRPRFELSDLERATALSASVRLALENAHLLHRMIDADRTTMLSHLTAGIAHEINTPLQYARDALAYLRSTFDDFAALVAAQKRAIDAAQSATSRAAVEAIEAIEAIETRMDLAYTLEASPKAFEQLKDGLEHIADVVATVKRMTDDGRRSSLRFDVNEEAREAIDRARSAAPLTLTIEARLASVPKVPGNPADFSEALMCLLENAIQSIERTGAPGKIEIATSTDEGNVVVAVSDTGTGIPREISRKVFDPFFTTQDVGRGRGLGLAIARSIIVERHGGSLTFDSREGHGTTFFIRMPLGETEAERFAS